MVTNSDYTLTEVTTGREENESTVTGQSATQDPKVHRFSYKGGVNIRIIDTPGIGDTRFEQCFGIFLVTDIHLWTNLLDFRGIEQDKENFQKILNCIASYEEIHGICILLKPNNSRLTVMFEFCIKELLTHLHRDAANNIVFLFTNARNTNYMPGISSRISNYMPCSIHNKSPKHKSLVFS